MLVQKSGKFSETATLHLPHSQSHNMGRCLSLPSLFHGLSTSHAAVRKPNVVMISEDSRKALGGADKGMTWIRPGGSCAAVNAVGVHCCYTRYRRHRRLPPSTTVTLSFALGLRCSIQKPATTMRLFLTIMLDSETLSHVQATRFFPWHFLPPI